MTRARMAALTADGISPGAPPSRQPATPAKSAATAPTANEAQNQQAALAKWRARKQETNCISAVATQRSKAQDASASSSKQTGTQRQQQRKADGPHEIRGRQERRYGAPVTDHNSSWASLGEPWKPTPADMLDVAATVNQFLVSRDETVRWPMSCELRPSEARTAMRQGTTKTA